MKDNYQVQQLQNKILRRALAKAILERAMSAPGHNDPTCTCMNCIPLLRIMDRTGLVMGREEDDLVFEDFEETWARPAHPNAWTRRDVFSIINTMRRYSSFLESNIFEGFMEVPMEIAQLLHEEGWRDLIQYASELDYQNSIRLTIIEEFLNAVIEICLTDDYLFSINKGAWQRPRF